MDRHRMESPFELPIFVHYRPSKRVCVANTLVHFGAIFCLFLTDLPIVATVLTGTCILALYSLYLKQFFSPGKVVFKLDRHDRWQLLRDGHETVDLRLLPGALVHPRIIILSFKEPTGRTRSCVLTSDNLDARTLRRLRVRLRWSQPVGRA